MFKLGLDKANLGKNISCRKYCKLEALRENESVIVEQKKNQHDWILRSRIEREARFSFCKILQIMLRNVNLNVMGSH
jgi:hypothetical protein